MALGLTLLVSLNVSTRKGEKKEISVTALLIVCSDTDLAHQHTFVINKIKNSFIVHYGVMEGNIEPSEKFSILHNWFEKCIVWEYSQGITVCKAVMQLRTI